MERQPSFVHTHKSSSVVFGNLAAFIQATIVMVERVVDCVLMVDDVDYCDGQFGGTSPQE